jgi:glutathionylspermidine synthase
MQRIPITERPNLKEAAAEHGFEYKDEKGVTGWNENAYYQFSLDQIEGEIESPTQEIEEMCFQVVDRAINDSSVLDRLCIPEDFWDYIANSWNNSEKNLIGRMDFSYGTGDVAKLLEYNADTPTTLYESAVFQWEWLEQVIEQGLVPDNSEQLNDIHESIVEAFSNFKIETLTHFACNQKIEDDKGTIDYIKECAQEAGVESCSLGMEDIGLDDQERLTDVDNHIITTLVKLYPWEWIMGEAFGQYVPACGVKFIEPPWKAILSNKGLLPLLWGMFEGHPNLLPAFFEDDPGAVDFMNDGDYVGKPMLSRQGANIEIVQGGKTLCHSEGPYADSARIIQGFHPLPKFENNYPLIGCWVVASKAVGLCIREDNTLITGQDAQIVPHIILN